MIYHDFNWFLHAIKLMQIQISSLHKGLRGHHSYETYDDFVKLFVFEDSYGDMKNYFTSPLYFL